MSYHLQAFNIEKSIKMEIWDAYDNCFNKIEDITLIRENTIPKGYSHLLRNDMCSSIIGSEKLFIYLKVSALLN